MAMKPKRQTSSNRGETGGGAPRGGAGNTGRIRPGMGTKPAPKPKVTLKPEPSSVTVKPGKYSLGPESANAANRKILAERSRTSTASKSAEKRALKAANKPAKYKSADAARQKSIDRANKAIANAKMGANGPKVSEATKMAYKRGLTSFDNLGKKPSKLSQAIAKKMYPKGIPSSKKK